MLPAAMLGPTHFRQSGLCVTHHTTAHHSCKRTVRAAEIVGCCRTASSAAQLPFKHVMFMLVVIDSHVDACWQLSAMVYAVDAGICTAAPQQADHVPTLSICTAIRRYT